MVIAGNDLILDPAHPRGIRSFPAGKILLSPFKFREFILW